jgi:DNA-binding transcriptional MerR regulator
MYYKIGEFARLSGLSIKTLRFYDQIKLLQPVHVDPRTRYRLYAPEQLREVDAILALKDLGASLEDMRDVAKRDSSSIERRRLLTKLRARAQRSIRIAQRSLTWIDAALDDSDTADRCASIVLKRRPAMRVASVRSQLTRYSEIVSIERELLQAIYPQFTGDSQGVLWHRCADSGAIEGEPFVQVSGNAPRSQVYDLKELPSTTVASTVCECDDSAAERAYESVARWLSLHDYQLAGPKREIYVGKILEIQFPVK